MKGNGLPTLSNSTKVYCRAFKDNSGALELAHTPKMQPRTKHINQVYHCPKWHVQYFCDRDCKLNSRNFHEDLMSECISLSEKENFEMVRNKIRITFLSAIIPSLPQQSNGMYYHPFEIIEILSPLHKHSKARIKIVNIIIKENKCSVCKSAIYKILKKKGS